MVNYRKDCELTQELIKFCADADVPAPIFETVCQEASLSLYLDSDEVELYDEDTGKLIAHKVFTPKVLKTVTFFYEDKKGKTGRRMVDVTEENDTYIKGIDSDKGEFRQFLRSRMSRVAFVK